MPRTLPSPPPSPYPRTTDPAGGGCRTPAPSSGSVAGQPAEQRRVAAGAVAVVEAAPHDAFLDEARLPRRGRRGLVLDIGEQVPPTRPVLDRPPRQPARRLRRVALPPGPRR